MKADDWKGLTGADLERRLLLAGDAPGMVLPDLNPEAMRQALGARYRVAEWSGIDAIQAAAVDYSIGGDDWQGEPAAVLADRIRRGVPAAGYLDAFDRARAALEDAGDAEGWSSGMTRRRRSVLRDEGDEVDVDRMLEGRVECWRKSVRGRVGTVYRLGFEVVASSFANQSYFANLCACAAVLGDALTVRGYSLEVIMLASHYNRGYGYVFEVAPVIRAGEPFDVSAFGAWSDRGVSRRLIINRHWVLGIQGVVSRTPKLARALGLDWIVGTSGPMPDASASEAVRAFMRLLAGDALRADVAECAGAVG